MRQQMYADKSYERTNETTIIADSIHKFADNISETHLQVRQRRQSSFSHVSLSCERVDIDTPNECLMTQPTHVE